MNSTYRTAVLLASLSGATVFAQEREAWTGAADGLRSLVFDGLGRKRGESR
ncbi:MAG: hypothetical protein V3T22_06525 [Planctomycetota bacterium]